MFPLSMCSVHQVSTRRLMGLALWVLMMLSLPLWAYAQNEERPAVDDLITPDQMANSLEESLTNHRAELESLKTELQQVENLQDKVQTEIKTYESQNAAQSQLLLVPQMRIYDLEKALRDNQLAFRNLTERVKTFQERWDSTSNLFKRSTDRLGLAQKQIDNIQASTMSDAQKRRLEAATRELIEVLEEKQKLGEGNLQIYNDMLDRMKIALKEKEAIGAKLRAQLKSLEKASLFRRYDLYRNLKVQVLANELEFMGNRIKAVFSTATWKAQWNQIKMGGWTNWLFFLAGLAAIIALQGRCRNILERIEERCKGPERYHRRLALFLLRHSLPYLGMMLLFGLYISLQVSLLAIGLGTALFYILLVLLGTRWGLDYLEHGTQAPPTYLRSFVARHLQRFLRFFRAAVIVAIVLSWFAGSESLLDGMLGDVLSVGFLAWAVVFWRQLKPVVVEGVREGHAAPNTKWITLLQWWTYIVFGGSLLLNLTGYRLLAGQWGIAWIKTVILLFWSWITFKALQEWHRDYRAEVAYADKDNPPTTSQLWRWSLFHLSRTLWFLALAAGLLWAWDPLGYLRSKLGLFFNYTLTVGNLKLSIKGVVLAIAILFITHMAVRMGRSLLDEKFLAKQSFERGFRDSILTISSYVGWGLGLVLALGILGVNTTSLAVVFGALSIGIGFGLQTIFNNFISGLILLFERPIQVGDTVDINGLWAEVKKINVRATVVQTFDNASVIIPNSEFVSQQVTNWSFKDARMRRNLEIGVAYGSDIDLVQNTLLDIVKNKKKVLKYPKPDVLFVDHAASALIFRLRIWVYLDDYWTVPSQIRCEIDQRFRELAIEIAFPQQDVHIRTLPGEIAPAASTSDGDWHPPQQEPTTQES